MKIDKRGKALKIFTVSLSAKSSFCQIDCVYHRAKTRNALLNVVTNKL